MKSTSDIDRAGEILRLRRNTEQTGKMLEVVSEWRSAHELPLKRVMTALKRQVGKQGLEAVVSGRTKRIRSIVSKLVREPKMSLSRMQDIGGCRVVTNTVEDAESLADQIRGELIASISAGGEIREKNYIASPKPDGYRSIHFVVRYLPLKPADLKPRRIEIQIRSKLQHRWATALETVDLFTGQTLKADTGDPRWQRFFALASSIFAAYENRENIPGTPLELPARIQEMREFAEKLHVVRKLQSWSSVMRDVLSENQERAFRKAYLFLVDLEVEKRRTFVTPYGPDELALAHREYIALEKQYALDPRRSVVLVTAYSLDEVRASFPGFYGDTKAFLRSIGLV